MKSEVIVAEPQIQVVMSIEEAKAIWALLGSSTNFPGVDNYAMYCSLREAVSKAEDKELMLSNLPYLLMATIDNYGQRFSIHAHSR